MSDEPAPETTPEPTPEPTQPPAPAPRRRRKAPEIAFKCTLRMQQRPRAQQLARLGLILVGAYDRAPAGIRQLRQALADYRHAGRTGGRSYRAGLLVGGLEATLRYLRYGMAEQPATALAEAELMAELDP